MGVSKREGKWLKRATQHLQTGGLLSLLQPVVFSCISNLGFTSSVFPPLILPNFPSLWHPQVSRGNPSSLTHERLTDLPLTKNLPAWFIFFDYKPFRNSVPSKLAQPEHQGSNSGHVFRCYQRINTLKGDSETETAGKGKGPSDHTPSTPCLTEEQEPGLLLTQVPKNFYICLEPIK